MNFLIGFGLSGLGFFSNVKNKKNFKILEKNSYLGGHSYSHKLDNIYFDEGAHILHSKNKKFINKFTKIDHNYQKSFVLNYKSSKWFNYPVQDNLIDINNKIKYLESFLIRNKNIKIKNFEDWCFLNYGEKITNDFYRIYNKKYWRKNLKELDVSWLSGRLISSNDDQVILNTFFKNNISNSSFNYFRYPKSKGFYNFFNDEFAKYSKYCHLNTAINNIDLKNKIINYNNNNENYNKIYSTIPLPELLKIIDFPKYIKSAINSLEHTSLICINLILKNNYKFKHHWHYIYDSNIPVSRISIINNISKVNSSKLGIQLEIFYNPKFESMKNIDYEKVIKKVFKTMNIDFKDLIKFDIRQIQYAYIISNKYKNDTVKLIQNFFSKYKIYPFGLYGDWTYYWSDQSYKKGKDFAALNNE